MWHAERQSLTSARDQSAPSVSQSLHISHRTRLRPRLQLTQHISCRWAAAASTRRCLAHHVLRSSCCRCRTIPSTCLSSADSRRLPSTLGLSHTMPSVAVAPPRPPHLAASPPEAARWRRCSILGVLVAQHPLRTGVVWSTEHARRSYTNSRGLASATRLCCVTCLAQHVRKRHALIRSPAPIPHTLDGSACGAHSVRCPCVVRWDASLTAVDGAQPTR